MKQTPNKILNDIREHLNNPDEYTYIIMGKPGPTGKTWLCDKLRQRGYNACEVSESLCWLIDYRDNNNHYLIKKDCRVVVIILNQPIEPVKEMTLEEIEVKLGHKVKLVSNEKSHPIKKDACKKCKYSVAINDRCRHGYRAGCAICPMNGVTHCICTTIGADEPCPYYEEEK